MKKILQLRKIRDELGKQRQSNKPNDYGCYAETKDEILRTCENLRHGRGID